MGPIYLTPNSIMRNEITTCLWARSSTSSSKIIEAWNTVLLKWLCDLLAFGLFCYTVPAQGSRSLEGVLPTEASQVRGEKYAQFRLLHSMLLAQTYLTPHLYDPSISMKHGVYLSTTVHRASPSLYFINQAPSHHARVLQIFLANKAFGNPIPKFGISPSSFSPIPIRSLKNRPLPSDLYLGDKTVSKIPLFQDWNMKEALERGLWSFVAHLLLLEHNLSQDLEIFRY